METRQNVESRSGRWSQDLEREIEAIEVMELLRASTTPPPDAGRVLSRELLSEMGRRLETISVAPPPPRRRNLPAAWLALVAAVAVLSAVCGHALATLRVDGSPRAVRPSAAALVVPAALAAEVIAVPAQPVAADDGLEVEPAAETVIVAKRLAPAVDGSESAAGRDSVAGLVATAVTIPDNPYGEGAEAPAAAPIVSARPADPIDALVGSALTHPERSGSAAKAEATNDLPDAVATVRPELPSRGEVNRAMGAVAELVRRCGADVDGRLVVEIRVSGATGRVQDAKTVDSEWSGTAAGACAARAVRIAKLPPFTANDLVVRYPFEI
jgi:hypothetical protein